MHGRFSLRNPKDVNYNFYCFFSWSVAGSKYEEVFLSQKIEEINAGVSESEKLKIYNPEEFLLEKDIEYYEKLNLRDTASYNFIEDLYHTIPNENGETKKGQMILRKGAVSAQKGEKLLIPINMRDGSLVCIGKGNEDWNCSAPHGAGRVMSRMKAKKELNLADFKAEMKGVWSSTVNKSSLDEAPMAYKTMDDIVENIGETAEIVKIIKPIYNFKAAE